MPEYVPIKKGIVVREVITPKPISKFPVSVRRDMHLRYTVKQMVQEGYDEMEFVDSHTVVKYELVPEEDFDNLYDAYLAWWNREYLPSHKAESSNLTFEILSVETDSGTVLIPAALCGYTLKNFQGNLNESHQVQGLDWTVTYKVREAGIFENEYHTLEDAYRAYKKRMESNPWANPSLINVYKLNPKTEKETSMQFTISKKQIKKQIENLENIRQDQIREMQKDLALKVSALEAGKSFNPYVIGCDILEKISIQLDYLYSLEVAESITCTAEEKDKIFKDFEITEVAE